MRLAPTGGSVTAAWYLFPRLKYGVFEWLDVCGGTVFATSTGQLVDPFNSRSGVPTNDLGGVPGNYLGTEIGALLDAFTNASGRSMDPVGMVRLWIAA